MAAVGAPWSASRRRQQTVTLLVPQPILVRRLEKSTCKEGDELEDAEHAQDKQILLVAGKDEDPQKSGCLGECDADNEPRQRLLGSSKFREHDPSDQCTDKNWDGTDEPGQFIGSRSMWRGTAENIVDDSDAALECKPENPPYQ